MTWVQRKAILPSPAEIAANPRARSAQLRVLEKN
jgi:16S rRNA C1402 N4-methylase RsmH